MRYIFKQDGRYYFRRKIPKTSQSFTFSLKTSNVRIATRKTQYFLRRAETLFLSLKLMGREEIMIDFDRIQRTLEDYRRKAEEEYSDYEMQRHKAFRCTHEGRELEGGHPECIKRHLKTLLDLTFAGSPQAIDAIFHSIFRRSQIPESFLESLNEKERNVFKFELVKTEAELLKIDLARAKSLFDDEIPAPESAHRQSAYSPNRQISPRSVGEIRKTSIQIMEEFLEKKGNDLSELHKYREPISIFLAIVNRNYLDQITPADIERFIEIFTQLPPKRTREEREHYAHFGENYAALAQYAQQENIKPLKPSTVQDKLIRIKSFLQYAKEKYGLPQNLLENRTILKTVERNRKMREEKSRRVPFTKEELNRFFNKSSWYTEKIEKHYLEKQERFYIPLIALFSGMRLNEIAQLYLDDIKCEESRHIHYFDITDLREDQRLKNPQSRRQVPIHSQLIRFGLIEYVRRLRDEGEARLFPNLYHTKGKGYGQAFSKVVNKKTFKEEWIDKERLENPKIRIDFHSFRYTFASRLVSGKGDDAIMDYIMGHQSSSENKNRYGKDGIHPLIEKKERIEQLKIDDLDFSTIEAFLRLLK